MSVFNTVMTPFSKALDILFGGDTVPDYETEVMPKWLQAIGYLKDEAVYWLDGNYVGFAFIGAPLAGADQAASEKLAGILQGEMPVDSVMQFILWTSPDMERTLVKYKIGRAHV